MTNSVIKKSCHRVMIGKTYWKRGGATKRSIRSRSNRHERRRNRQIAKAENSAMRRILKAPKRAAQAAIRGEIGISNMKSRIARSMI